MPVWKGAATDRCDAVAMAVAEWDQKQNEERRRLLYVAMTRAESWLVVAAAGDTGDALESWYSMIADGATRTDLVRSKLPVAGLGDGLRLSFGDWPEQAVDAETAPVITTAPPDWATRMPPHPADYVSVLTATGLGGAKVIGGPSQGDRDAAMLRGTRLHLLLEHLPAYPRDTWAGLSRTLLSGAEGGLADADEVDDLLSEVTQLIDAPALDQVLRPAPDTQVLAEVAITTPMPDGRILNGIIDRLVIGPTEILAVDYKTNSTVPDTPEATPEGILRQMAAYRTALRGIWPDRSVKVAVLWTQTQNMMELPDAILDQALDSVMRAP